MLLCPHEIIRHLEVEIIFNGEKYISIDEVLEKLEIREYKLYRLVNNNEIPKPMKPDPRAFWKKSDIEAYLKKTGKIPGEE